MKNLWLLILFSFKLHAAAVAEINPQSFQIHVRPQLVNIQEDIQQILLTFPGYPAEVFSAQALTDQLMITTRRAQETCHNKINPSCMTPLTDSIRILHELEILWLKQEKQTTFPTNPTLSILVGKARWNQIIIATRRLRSILISEQLALSASRETSRMNMWDWRRRVDEIEGWQNLLVIDYIPGKLQEDFRQAWMNFFRPLQKQCVISNNRQYLTKNIDSLNFYWNLLNMRLTKRLKRTPEGMSGPLNAIQNRWNQVLRVAYF